MKLFENQRFENRFAHRSKRDENTKCNESLLVGANLMEIFKCFYTLHKVCTRDLQGVCSVRQIFLLYDGEDDVTV